MKNQLTIRGIDKETIARLRDLAIKHGISLNKAAVLLMRKGAGVRLQNEGPDLVGNTLDSFIGSWAAEDEAHVLRTVEDLNTPDETLWP